MVQERGFCYTRAMTKRYDIRAKIEKLLALANRPGTPAEGEAALAAAQRMATAHGFTLQRRRRVVHVHVEDQRFRNDTPTRGHCRWCGAIFTRRPVGRPRIFCSGRCRVAAFRAR